jgi:hypothetical protein
MGVFSYLPGTDDVNGGLNGKFYHSRGVRKMTPTEEYRFNAATCLRLAKTMDDDNKRRLEDIAQQWLDLAKEEERQFLQAAE